MSQVHNHGSIRFGGTSSFDSFCSMGQIWLFPLLSLELGGIVYLSTNLMLDVNFYLSFDLECLGGGNLKDWTMANFVNWLTI
jgi:hypothetical protein